MMIKSMSRKKETFSQLMEYVTREEMSLGYEICHNTAHIDPALIVNELKENASHLKNRDVYNTLYHEILSITRPQNLPIDEQKQKLKEIAERYLKKRAPDNLAFAALHDDKGQHLHYHFIISANEVGQVKRHYLTKFEFEEIKVDLERHVLAHYPELEQVISIGKVAKHRTKEEVYQHTKRTGKKIKFLEIEEKTRSLLSSMNSKELVSKMVLENIKFYERKRDEGKGLFRGIIDTRSGKKYKFETLNMTEEYEQLKDRLELNTIQESVIKTVRVGKQNREQKQDDIVEAIERKKSEQAKRDAEHHQSNIQPRETEHSITEAVITPDQVRAGLDAEQRKKGESRTKIPRVSEEPSQVHSEMKTEPKNDRHRARPEPEEVLDVDKEAALTHRKGIFEKIRNRMGRKKDRDHDRDH